MLQELPNTARTTSLSLQNPRGCHRLLPDYEAFRLFLHCDCVDCTLPHRSALVSKTLSQRKAGFWYGAFFFGVCVPFCCSSLLIAVLPPIPQLRTRS
jgi:hypothetical protein